MDKNPRFTGAEARIIEEAAATFIKDQAAKHKSREGIPKIYLHSEIVQTSVSNDEDLKTPKMLNQFVSSLGSFINRKTEYLVPRNWDEYGEFLFLHN